MSLETEFKTENELMPVPYGANLLNLRTNNGYFDLRGDAKRASEILEAAESPALRNLLMKAADAASPIFTLGCDLGSHSEQGRLKKFSKAAGGYIQFSFREYMSAPPKRYLSHSKSVVRIMEKASHRKSWRLEFTLQPCQFNFGAKSENGGSVSIWFFTFCATFSKAYRDREVLIASLSAAIFDPLSFSTDDQ